jgi:hypothetical protein
VNTRRKPPYANAADASAPAGRPPFLVVLVVLLFAEAALVVGALVWLVVQLTTAKPASMASALAIVVMAALAAIWVTATAIGALRRRPWIRGSAVTWQLVQAAVAVGCFQGLYAEPWLGWALLIPAVAGVLLVVSPSVTRVTRRVV